MSLELIPGLVVLGALGYLVFVGASRSAAYARSESRDAGDVLKSVVISFGLYLAMLAVSVGLIDLLQAFVRGERLAGSNSDLARGLSLLIVGTPVFVLLMN